MSLPPTAELVARAWLADLGYEAASKLPDAAAWTGDVFVTVMVLGGQVDQYVMIKTPVMSVDVWAKPSKGLPLWTRANVVADAIYKATFEGNLGEYTMPVAGYDTALIKSVCVMSNPIRINDPAGLAHYNLSVQFVYA